jgi:hypothetical protein
MACTPPTRKPIPMHTDPGDPRRGTDRRKLPTLPIEPSVLELLTRAKLARSIRIVNGLVPGNLSRALAGESIGTVIRE